MAFHDPELEPIPVAETVAADRAARAAAISGREAGLRRKLTSSQVSMIALGGAIGTGLFLGSALSVQAAGPGVIFELRRGSGHHAAVAVGAGGNAVAHPVADPLGVCGKSICTLGWICDALFVLDRAGGGYRKRSVAAAIYCRYWMPDSLMGVHRRIFQFRWFM